MVHKRSAGATSLAGRALAALVLAVALLSSAFPPSLPARAEHQPSHSPAAKLQIALKNVHIFSDRDLIGKGEINIFVAVHRCASADPQGDAPCTVGGRIAYAHLGFSASSGDDIPLNAIAATPSHRVNSFDDEDASFAVYPDDLYVLSVVGVEDDAFMPGVSLGDEDWDAWNLPVELGPEGRGTTKGDYMGMGALLLDVGNDFRAGPHSLLGAKDFGADYSIDFEIRRLVLPDLVPLHAIYRRLDDGREVVCASALNRGEAPSDPFPLYFAIDPRGDAGEYESFTMPGLAVAEFSEHCFLIAPFQLTPGEHDFVVGVNIDPLTRDKSVAEINYGNNYLREKFRAGLPPPGQPAAAQDPGSPGGAPTPTPTPLPGQADLVVTAIRVKGEEPSGSNDCDPGKNDVTVVVKNQGAAAATGFAVRILPDNDDDETKEKTGLNLDAGKDLEVRFDDLRLNEGDHKLVATADSKNTVSESNEDNNKREVSVKCKDEDD